MKQHYYGDGKKKDCQAPVIRLYWRFLSKFTLHETTYTHVVPQSAVSSVNLHRTIDARDISIDGTITCEVGSCIYNSMHTL